jgi:hypothetical protein
MATLDGRKRIHIATGVLLGVAIISTIVAWFRMKPEPAGMHRIQFESVRVDVDAKQQVPVALLDAEFVSKSFASMEGPASLLTASACAEPDHLGAERGPRSSECPKGESTSAVVLTPRAGELLGLSNLSIVPDGCAGVRVSIAATSISLEPEKCALKMTLLHSGGPPKLAFNRDLKGITSTLAEKAVLTWHTDQKVTARLRPFVGPATNARMQGASRVVGVLAQDLKAFSIPGHRVCSAKKGVRVALDNNAWDFDGLSVAASGVELRAFARDRLRTCKDPNPASKCAEPDDACGLDTAQFLGHFGAAATALVAWIGFVLSLLAFKPAWDKPPPQPDNTPRSDNPPSPDNQKAPGP